MKKFNVVSCMVITVLLSKISVADDFEIDENALFGDTALSIVDSSELVDASESLKGIDSTVVAFSGEVTGVGEAAASRDWFKNRDRKEIKPGALMLGDLMLDVRFPFGIKTFADMEIYAAPKNGGISFNNPDNYFSPDSMAGFTIAVPELFLDANVNRRMYFRAGKQVLQWGRGYFWNPTDLVNVEKKQFVEKVGSREGTYGIKTHIPFGTRWNIYSFIDMNDLASVDDLAGAVRFEGLFGGTEAGIALWGKPHRDPIFGFDFSTSILSWSVYGEMSITRAGNLIDTTLISLFEIGNSKIDKPAVRLSAGFMRMFDVLDVDDRVMVIGEFYFNQVGDRGNAIEKFHLGDLIENQGNQSLSDSSIIGTDLLGKLSGSFEFNSVAQYYSAFFVTVSKFILYDMTLQLNGLVNWNHRCAMLTAGVNYTTLHNFSLGFQVTGVVGPEESEYTLMGTGGTARLTAGVTF